MTDKPKSSATPAIGPGNEDRKHAERRYREVVKGETPAPPEDHTSCCGRGYIAPPSPPAEEPVPDSRRWCLAHGMRRDLCCGKAEPPPAADPSHPKCCAGRVCVLEGHPENCACSCHRLERAKTTPAADPEGEWWLRGEQRRDLDAAEAGVKLQQKADEGGATHEPLCGKCGLTRGTLIHRPAEFSDDPGAEDCHPFVTGEFVEGEPQPGIEAGRGEECAHRWEEVTVMAQMKSCYRCGLDENEVKLHAAEEHYRQDISGWQRRVADITESRDRMTVLVAEAVDSKLAAEEARRLAEQERDETGAILEAVKAELHQEPVSDFMESFPVVRETKEAVEAAHSSLWLSCERERLQLEVVRLQGELAGLRKAARVLVTYWDNYCEDVMEPLNDPESGERFEVMSELFDALRAALAAQEGAEKGTKG